MRKVVAAAWLSMACGADVIETAEITFEPICGDDRPVELLALDDDEQVGWVDGLGESGEMLVLTFVGEDRSAARRRVVVDACGVAEGEPPLGVRSMGRWDDALVGCDEDGDLLAFSGPGDPNPKLLARRGCPATRTSQGYVTLDADGERLVLLHIDGATVSTSTLLDGVLVPGPGEVTLVSVVDDRALVQTVDLRVVSVDPRSGDTRLELDAASQFHATEAVVVYRPPTPDPDGPTEVWLRDRKTGTEDLLEPALPASWTFGASSEPDMVVLRRIGQVNEATRWFRIRPTREVIPPEGTRIVAARAGGLVWLARNDAATGILELSRWHEGDEPEVAMTCDLCGALEDFGHTHIDLVQLTANIDEHILWRLDDEGGPARRIGNPVGFDWAELPGERILTVLDEDAGRVGSLVLYAHPDDPGTMLAPNVERSAITWTRFDARPGEILYQSLPDDGPRGLYRARLAPP